MLMLKTQSSVFIVYPARNSLLLQTGMVAEGLDRQLITFWSFTPSKPRASYGSHVPCIDDLLIKDDDFP